MLADLISVTTSDEIILDGAFFPAATEASRPGPVDAMLLIHGSGGRFYAPATRIMAEDLSRREYPCLALNTRGHDTIWIDTATGVPQGNAFEILDISRQDLRAGVDFLAERGYQRIGLLGHSMGAVQAQDTDKHSRDLGQRTARMFVGPTGLPSIRRFSFAALRRHRQQTGLLPDRFETNNHLGCENTLDAVRPMGTGLVRTQQAKTREGAGTKFIPCCVVAL